MLRLFLRNPKTVEEDKGHFFFRLGLLVNPSRSVVYHAVFTCY